MKIKFYQTAFSKRLISSSLFFLLTSVFFAKQIPPAEAKKVAENFFMQFSTTENLTCELTSTHYDANGHAVFYAFNFNSGSGFVLVSADDAARPIIGYSTEQGFESPDQRSPLSFWLKKRSEEITYLREKSIPAGDMVRSDWEKYSVPQNSAQNKSSSSNSVTPLLLTKWNQAPLYNDSCPGGSVTGCVATTMAQIMRYWKYPAQGNGASSYCNCVANGYNNEYGVLSANYGNTNYNWNNMPYSLPNHNADVAQLMFHCGVSVEMDYSPTGSSAVVINLDSPISAENAFTTYFEYDPALILGVYRSSYSDPVWMSMLKNDLDIGRPVQYAGFGNQGGHTWVCDGYDQNNFFHMNWGWGISGNGFYDLNALNPNGQSFTAWQEALFDIVPKAKASLDAGMVMISPTSNGCTNNQYSPNITFRNYGSTTLSNCTINYKLDNNALQTINWTGTLVRGQATNLNIANYTLSNGNHTLVCYVSNPNGGSDGYAANDLMTYTFTTYASDNLPIVEGFENPAITNTHWGIIPSSGGSSWAYTSQAASGGVNSLMIDNLNNTAGNVSVLQGLNTYNFAGTQSPYIYFKVAYQRKSAANNDKLRLDISNDCGNTWWTRWSKQGAALATNSVLSSSPFVASTNDFVQFVSPAVITNNTIFRWVFVADPIAPGNNIYLDDINIFDDASAGIKVNASQQKSFVVFPNPSNGETFVKLVLANSAQVEVSVSDIYGCEVIKLPVSEYSEGEQLIPLNQKNELPKGIYFVNALCNGQHQVAKLIIE